MSSKITAIWPHSALSPRPWLIVVMLAALLMMGSSPGLAHNEQMKKKQAEVAQVVQPSQPGQTAAGPPDADRMTAQMGETMAGAAEDRSAMTTFERLVDWLGRLHPTIVHFPIAFFPAALFTAIIARRRPAFAAPVQFLVIAGGIIAPIAALLGWFDALGTDPDPLLTIHRWLGTAIGVCGLGLAAWAWRRPDVNRSIGMIIGLAAMTTAIIIQGWYGGAMIHGIDHLNW